MKFIKEILATNNIGKKISKLLQSYNAIVVRSSRLSDDFWIDQISDIGEMCPMKEDLDTGNKTGDFWTDIKYDANYPNTYLHSNTRQPLHTDGSYESKAPNITFFFCINPADFGGDTVCLELDLLINCLRIEQPKLLEELQEKELIFSKGEDYKKSKIINEKKINWNYFRVEKCNLVENFHNYLEQRILQMGVVSKIRLEKGDALFFNDELILHGRNAFIGNRWLKKGGITWTG